MVYEYFYEWGRSPRTAEHFNINEYNLAEKIHQYAKDYDFYLQDVLADQKVIEFVSRPAKIHSFRNRGDFPELAFSEKPKIFILLNPARYTVPDPLLYDKLMEKYHHGKIWKGLGIPGELPWVLAVEVD